MTVGDEGVVAAAIPNPPAARRRIARLPCRRLRRTIDRPIGTDGVVDVGALGILRQLRRLLRRQI
jgi:hypothetical protein